MLLSPRKNGLTSISKEVRVFRETEFQPYVKKTKPSFNRKQQRPNLRWTQRGRREGIELLKDLQRVLRNPLPS